ncbi:MAG: hypothetical protein IJT61_00800 [Bacteroidales bacterium]|nr:hypothetical protein [Bacteroidales bacterium]
MIDLQDLNRFGRFLANGDSNIPRTALAAPGDARLSAKAPARSTAHDAHHRDRVVKSKSNMTKPATYQIQQSPARRQAVRGMVSWSKDSRILGALPLHPVLNPQTRDALEVVGVASYKDKVFFQCGGGDIIITLKKAMTMKPHS